MPVQTRIASPLAARPDRTRQRRHRTASALWADRSGAMFMLAGLLLVLGFVALGATLYMTSNVGEDTARSQRDSLNTPVSQLLQDLNLSAREATQVGDTNVTAFLDRLENVEDQVRAQASREGIYMELAPVSNPDPSLYQRASRCIANDPARSFGGVIVGYETGNGRETIAGVVYHVQASNGRETLDIQFYVRITQCLPDQLTLLFDGLDVDLGTATDIDDGKQGNDGNAAVTLQEDPQGSQVLRVDGEADESTLEYYGWSDPHGMFEDGGIEATHPATPLPDYMRFRFDTSGLPDDLLLYNATVRLDAFATGVTDDFLQLSVIHGSTVMWEENTTLSSSEQTYRISLGPSPGGNATWTVQEAAGIMLSLKIIEVDKFDPPAFFAVDYTTIEFDLHVPLRHVLDVGVDYPRIPAIYDQHTVEVRYTYSGNNGTVPEDIHMQFYDGVTDTWSTRITLNETNGVWTTKSYALTSAEVEDGYIEMRLVDTDKNDWHPKLEDDIQIDYILLRNTFTP